jgi:hypothetical protein
VPFDLISKQCQNILNPVLPVMESQEGEGAQQTLGTPDVMAFIKEQSRGFGEQKAVVTAGFVDNRLVPARDACALLVIHHLVSVMHGVWDGVDYVEWMLRQQLVTAIGKEVTPDMVGEFMKFHVRRIYNATHVPHPFCYDVRRAPGFSPEGSVSLEAVGDDTHAALFTATGVRDGTCGPVPPMSFSINAATQVQHMGGDDWDALVWGLVRHVV